MATEGLCQKKFRAGHEIENSLDPCSQVRNRIFSIPGRDSANEGAWTQEPRVNHRGHRQCEVGLGIRSGAHHHRGLAWGAPQTSPLRPSQIRMASELAIEHNKASLTDTAPWTQRPGFRSYAP